ncbi:MAG: uracil-DNA glycosylase, partial [Sphingomonadales bacterium]
ATLAEFGLSRGRYDARTDDGLTLDGAIIVNSVKCLPPQNKPTSAEITNCRPFFETQLAALPKVSVIIALGRIAHDATLRAVGARLSAFSFGHGAIHKLPCGRQLVDSYHCSRYNTNTGRLTPEMFADVFRTARTLRDQTSGPNSSISPR